MAGNVIAGASGAIQPYGILIAVDPVTGLVEVVSENLGEFLGESLRTSLDDVLGRPLTDLLGDDLAAMVAKAAASDLLEPEVTTVTLPCGPVDRRRQDLTLYRSGGLLVCELEPSNAISDEALAGFYQAANLALGRLQRSHDTEALCDTAVNELRALTGYDRVTVYRFDDDAHGEIVAEARRTDLEPLLGLHYPASDIPRQARLLYVCNWLRAIGDVNYTPARLRCLSGTLPPEGLDLSLSALRSVSPVHLQYLRNMGVHATLTISLIVDGRLWGMLACHHDTPHRVSGHLRAACRTFGQSLSLQLRAAAELHGHDYAARLASCSAQVVAALAAAETLASGVRSAPEALLGMVSADGAVLSVSGRRTTVGTVPTDDVLDLVVRAIGQRVGERREPLAVDVVTRFVVAELGEHVWEQTGIDPATVTASAAGVLFLPLGQIPGDFVLWLRAERAQSVRWAGPGASFDEWQELVRGRSRPWLPVEVRSARELGQAYPELALHRAQNRLVRLAMYDSLTGLPNRAMLADRLSAEIEVSIEGPARMLAVMFVELDGLGEVNDQFGQEAGDHLLVALAQRLSSSLRADDVLARVGGAEFVLVISSMKGVEQVVGIAQRVIDQCRIAFPISPDAVAEVSASVGIALHQGSGDATDLLRRADNALYLAKRAGRDQIRVYGVEHAAQTEESRLETELERAIAEEQLVVHLQPVIRLLADGSTVDGSSTAGGSSTADGNWRLDGAEALVRWQHPERGLVPPDEFIPLAERTGQIIRLGDYVLERALRALRTWSLDQLTCSVNVSAVEVSRPGFASSVLRRLAEHDVIPHRLCLEITETQMMQRPEYVAGVLTELGRAGVRIAIDDFGTGFSSLAYVRTLPAHLLKIDRTFVSGLPDSPRDVSVVAAAIRLAHELGMEVVAEGVETPGQVTALLALGCDLAQGYLFGRPVPMPEFGVVAARSVP